MSRAARHAPKLTGGQKYVVHYGARPVGHVTNPMHASHTVCGQRYANAPPKGMGGPHWGTPTSDLGAGQRLCGSCDRMRHADTVRLPGE